MNAYEVKTEQGSGWIEAAVTIAEAASQAVASWKCNGSEIVSITRVIVGSH